MPQWDDQPPENLATRVRESLPVFTYVAWLTLKVMVVMSAAGVAAAIVRRLMGEDISLWKSALRALELSAAMGLAGIGAGLTSFLAAHFVKRQGLYRTGAIGLAASLGLWSTIALLAPNAFISIADVETFGLLVVGFGALFPFLLWRLKEKMHEGAP